MNVVLALAGFALIVPAPAQAAAAPATGVKKRSSALHQTASKPSASKPSRPARAKVEADTSRSADAARVVDWIDASRDNGSLPYIIVDKKAASLFLFTAKGKPLGKVPVLIGVATGDDATPGVGSKNLAEIGPAEKTTPAGRFLAKYGLAAGRQKVLWVDYATSVALHPIPPGVSKKERRRQRMLSPTIDDNRITFGCINVPTAFYTKSVRPLFQKKGGYVYVLPDTKPLEVVFPPLLAQPFINSTAS